MKNLLIFAFLIVLSSCKKDKSVESDYFAFGKSYGFCVGNCTTFFQVRNKNLYPDDMEYTARDLVFKNTQLPTAKYNLAKQFEDNFPAYLKNHPGGTFGCPDCVDQGTIRIEKKENGVLRTWFIDPAVENQPEEIRAYIAELNVLLTQL